MDPTGSKFPSVRLPFRDEELQRASLHIYGAPTVCRALARINEVRAVKLELR